MNYLIQPSLAAFDGAAFMALCIPLLALMIPIVALLIRHQQTMAQIIHGQGADKPQLDSEIDSLRRELQQLRQHLGQHEAALEKLGALSTRETSPPSVNANLQDRLRS